MREYKEKASFALDGLWGFISFICFVINTVGRLCMGLALSFLLYHIFRYEDGTESFEIDSRFEYYIASISDEVFKKKMQYSYITVLVTLIALFVIAYIISIITGIGLNNLYLKISRYEEISLSDLFIDKKYIFKAVTLDIIINIRLVLWALLLIVPAIIKGYAYSKAKYVFLDNPDKDIFECIRESERIMFDGKWDNFILDLHFIFYDIIIGIVSKYSFLLEAGIMSYYDPYIGVANAFFYLDLIGEKSSEVPIGKNNIEEFKEKIRES